MNVFEAVKGAVTPKAAAEFYGLEVRHGFARCPFHDDHTPSLKLDERYHCFGCGADGGDATDLVAALFHLDPLAAAKKIAADFRLGYDTRPPPRPRPAPQRWKGSAGAYCEAEERTFRVLCRYYHRLQAWREKYAPTPNAQTWHPLFVEALRETDHTAYLLDILISGDKEEKAALVTACRDKIAALERRLSLPVGPADVNKAS